VKGRDGNILAVDSDGYMTAILKGLYGSTLKTIALDSEGRIYGYQVDDLDQWGKTLLVGNAEQAVRLGSPVSWDRRGQVVGVFDFAKGFHGVRRLTAGTGAAIELDPTWWQYGGYSVKLTGGSDGAGYAAIAPYFGVPPSTTFGMDVNWSAVLTPNNLGLRITIVDNEVAHFAYLRYDFATDKLQYRDTGAAWQDIATQDVQLNAYHFHRIKLVIDIDNDVFVRAMLDNHQYDMTAAILTSAAVGQGDSAKCEVYCYSDASENDVIYIDSIIFTVQEPL